jgi:hypothetical protein
MRGRSCIAAVGVAAMAVVAALSSSAGATTAGTWTVSANGGFVGVNLANQLQVSGGGSEADASSGNLSEAIGTGACISQAATSNPCPTSPTSSLSGLAVDSSQVAIAKNLGQTASPSPSGSSVCAVPAVNVSLLTLGPACGAASAAEDGSGNPTAASSGSLAALTLNLSSLLGSGGLALPSELCSGIAAATSTAGSGTGSLPAPVSTILTTANGLLSSVANGSPLSPTSVDTSSPVAGACSIIGGVLNEVGAASPVGTLLSAVTSAAGVGSLPPLLSVTVGGSTSKVSSSGGTLTATATQEAADINVLGMLDIQVTPTTASVAVNQATGQVTPSCNSGVVSVTADGQTLPLSQLNELGSVLQEVLTELDATPLGSLLDQLLNFQPDGVLSCTPSTSNGGTTGSATADSIDLNLAPAENLLSLDLGNVSASASTTPVTSSPNAVPASNPTPTATPAAPPAVVPNVTTVHTGEYWAGTLPIVLMAGMGLAGILLIGRRRIASVARSINPITRRRSSP